MEQITEHDWDELIQEGPIQLMLNDTEVLLASKPGLPAYTEGYIQTLTKELTCIEGTNGKSMKNLHEKAVEQLIKNPHYWDLPIEERQIPLLMSTAIKPIILTTNTDYDDVDYEGYYAEYGYTFANEWDDHDVGNNNIIEINDVNIIHEINVMDLSGVEDSPMSGQDTL